MIPTTPRPKRLRRFLWLPLAVLLLYWAALLFFQRLLIFPSGMANSRALSDRSIEEAFPGVERRWLTTDEGQTEYWLQLAPEASAERPAGLVVFTHGNAELIDGQAWVNEGFQRLGYSVAMCEYRGYGRSNGSPSQAAIGTDHVSMMEQLVARPEVDASRLIYFGRSIGTGVACELAKKVPPKAIILLSPLRSISGMASKMLAPSFLVLDPFDNEEVLREFSGSVLLMHGTRDTVIPFDHSLALHQVSVQSELEALDSGHNDISVRAPWFWKRLEAFVELAIPSE